MKKLILTLILLFSVAGLCACGNTTTTEDTTSSNTTAEQATTEQTTTEQTTTEQTTTEAPVPAVLELNTSAVKVAYLVGDQLNLEGLKVEEVRGEARTEVALSACTVKVLDASDNEVEGTFQFAGKYTVEVSYNGNKASYEVTVNVHSYATVAEAGAASSAKADTVKSGTAVITNDGTATNYAYEFGPNHFKYSEVNEYSDNTYFFELLDEETAFGVYVDGEENLFSVYGPTVDNLVGVDFRGFVGYSADIYGVDAILAYFYEQSQDEELTILNYQETVVGPTEENYGTYSFSYAVADSYQYSDYTVTFTLAANESVASVSITYNLYSTEEKLVRDDNDNVIGVAENAEPDYVRTLVATQEVGARTLVNEYPASMFVFESFDIVDASNNPVENTVEMNAGDSLSLKVVNAAPSTANSNIDSIDVIITDENGNNTWTVYGSEYNGEISLSAYGTGTFYVTVSTTKVTKSFELVVNPAVLSSFEAGVYSNGELTATTSTTAYVDNSLSIGAVVNQYANASFTAVLTSGDENANLVLNDVTGRYEFTANVTGTYVVTLTSSVNGDFTATLTIEVTALPTLAEILTGTWENISYWEEYTYVFTPDSEGATSGTCAIHAVNYMEDSDINLVIKYSVVEGNIVCTDLKGNELTMWDYAFTVANYVVVATYGDGMEICVLTKQATSDETSIAGEYVYSVTNQMTGTPITSNLVFNTDGTGSYLIYAADGTQYAGTFNWAYADGNLTLSDVTPGEGSKSITLSATYASGVITLTYGEETNDFALNN